MGIGKRRAGAALLCLGITLCFPAVQIRVNAEQSSYTTVTTTVPETHRASLEIVGSGTVTVSGNAYTGEDQSFTVSVPRLEETAWEFVAADGWILETVYYNGADVIAELADGIYQAKSVHADGTTVKAVFVKQEEPETETETEPQTEPETKKSGNGNSSGTGKKPSASGTGAKTGDTTHIVFWIVALVISGGALGAVVIRRRCRKTGRK